MKTIIKIIYGLIWAIGIIGALYVGGWLMFIHPIMEACKHFDAGTLTGVMVGITVLKCIFASGVATIIVYITTLGAAVFKAITGR